MDVQVTQYKRCDLIKFAGVLDGSNVDDLAAVLNPLIESGRHKIVLDMSDVKMLTSKGIWLLIDIQKKAKKKSKGEVVMACLSPRIQESLKLVAMDGYFKVYDSVVEAVGSF